MLAAPYGEGGTATVRLTDRHVGLITLVEFHACEHARPNTRSGQGPSPRQHHRWFGALAPPIEGVEAQAEEVEQRDRRELADPLPVAGQERRDRLGRAVRHRDAEPDGPDRLAVLLVGAGDAGRRRCRRRRRAPAARPRPSRAPPPRSRPCSAVTPSTERFTSVAYDATEPRNVRLAPGTFAIRAPMRPPVSDSATPSVQPRALAAAAAPPTPSSRRRPRRRGRRGSRAAPCSSASMSASASSAVVAFAVRRTTMPSMPRARNAIVGFVCASTRSAIISASPDSDAPQVLSDRDTITAARRRGRAGPGARAR